MPDSGRPRDQVVTMLWGWLLIAATVAGIAAIVALLVWAWPG